MNTPLMNAAIGLVFALASAGVFADNGRYEAISIPEGGRSGENASLNPRVFIIDTVDGYLWTWSENEPVADGESKRYGTVLRYQGRVRPGTKMGEVVDAVQ